MADKKKHYVCYHAASLMLSWGPSPCSKTKINTNCKDSKGRNKIVIICRWYINLKIQRNTEETSKTGKHV